MSSERNQRPGEFGTKPKGCIQETERKAAAVVVVWPSHLDVAGFLAGDWLGVYDVGSSKPCWLAPYASLIFFLLLTVLAVVCSF
jgi:hypothetical protein